MHELGQARLNNVEFSMVALCAVEHLKFKPEFIPEMLGNVSIDDLLAASKAGAKVGPEAWRLIDGAMAEDCGENASEAL